MSMICFKKEILIPFLILFNCSLFAQSEWDFFTVLQSIKEVETVDDKAYVANKGGLLIIDLETGEENLLNPNNSNFLGLGVEEIEILENGHVGMSSSTEGFYYYDGNDFFHYKDTVDGKSVGRIYHLRALADQLFFLAHLTEENQIVLVVFEDGELSIQNYFEDVPGSIGFDTDGNLWAISLWRGNLKQFKEGVEVQNIEFSLNIDLNLDTYFLDSQNRHWLSYTAHGEGGTNGNWSYSWLLLYEDGQWYEYSISRPVNKFHELDSGEVIFDFNDFPNKYYIVENDEVIEYRFNDLLPDLGDLEMEDAAIIAIEDFSNFWMMLNNGINSPQLLRVKDEGFDLYATNKEELKFETHPNLTQDCEGNLFFGGAENHFQKYINGEWITVYPDYIDEDCRITQIVKNPHTCEMWGLGHEGGCLSLWQINGNEVIETAILPQDFIEAITFNSDGTLYVAYNNKVVSVDSVGRIDDLSIQGFNSIRDIYYSKDGSLWVTGYDYNLNSLVKRKKNGLTTTFTQGFGRLSSSIYVDADDFIWLRSSNTLYKFDENEKWVDFYIPDFNDNISKINDFVVDSKGNGWIAFDQGLAYWDKETIVIYDTSNLPAHEYDRLELVNDSILWISHDYGLTKIKIDLNNLTLIEEPNSNPSPYALYPNPSSGSLTLTNPLLHKREIDVFTNSGELVSSTTSESSIWTTNLESGVYWVRIAWATGQAVEKVVVLR